LDFFAYLLRCSDGHYYAGHTTISSPASPNIKPALCRVTRRKGDRSSWSGRSASRIEIKSLRQSGGSRVGAGPRRKPSSRGIGTPFAALARKPVLRDAASTSSAATQDERDQSPSLSAHPEEGLSPGEGPSRRTPAIVLVRRSLGENIGKAARAMLNFGLTDLRLVSRAMGGRTRRLVRQHRARTWCWSGLVCSRRSRSGGGLPVRLCDHGSEAGTGRAGGDAGAGGTGDPLAGGRFGDPVRRERSGWRRTRSRSPRRSSPFRSTRSSVAEPCAGGDLVAYEWSKHQGLAVPTEGDVAGAAGAARAARRADRQLHQALDEVGYFFPPIARPHDAQHRSARSSPGRDWSAREIQALRGMIRAITHPRQRGRASKQSNS
jgi:tRNA/rRNA methyltransferase